MAPGTAIGSAVRPARRSRGPRLLAVLIATIAVMAAAQEVRAEKLVVFKNGKAMRALKVVEDGPWLKCEFEDGNFMSIPKRNVGSIEDATLLPANVGGAANQLVEGSRGAANLAPSSPGPEVSAPSVGAGRFGRNAREAADGQEGQDDEGARSQARNEEAEALRNAPAAFGRRSNPLGASPIQGLQPLGQPLGQPVNQASPTDQRRGISRKRDRGNQTQLPDQDDN